MLQLQADSELGYIFLFSSCAMSDEKKNKEKQKKLIDNDGRFCIIGYQPLLKLLSDK